MWKHTSRVPLHRCSLYHTMLAIAVIAITAATQEEEKEKKGKKKRHAVRGDACPSKKAKTTKGKRRAANQEQVYTGCTHWM